MKRSIKLIIVGVVLWIELLFVTFHNPYPHGPIVDVWYRQSERHAAHSNYVQHPSAETRAVFDVELKRMRRYVTVVTILKLTVLVAVNTVGIYCFLKHDEKKATA